MIHGVEWDDLGFVSVYMDHLDFPQHRFVVGISPDGEITGVSVCDRRFMHRSPEPAPGSSRWGPIAPVTRRLLAALPLGDLERAARDRRIEDELDFRSGAMEIGDAEWLKEVPPLPRARRRGGRPTKANLFYAMVAQRYVWLLARSPHPVRELAGTVEPSLGLPASRNTVKGWIAEARVRGLLTDAPKSAGPIGKAGGRLTAKGRKVLKEEKAND